MSFILVIAKLNFQDYSSLQSHNPSEIILICWFAAKKLSVTKAVVLHIYVGMLCIFFRIL